MIEFERQNSIPTASDLVRFEETLDAPLPADYREFLEKFNGGRPIEYEVEVPRWGKTPLNSLLGLGAQGRSDLYFQVSRMRAMLPPGVMPIGTDAGGNYFCLALMGDRPGAVLFWDHEHSTPDENEGETKFKMYQVAASFASFLDSLRPI